MASQECPKCGHVFAESEISYLRSSGPTGLMIILTLLVALLIRAVH